MKRILVALPLIVIALTVAAAPAAAQSTTVYLRYWPTQTNVSLSGGPAFRAYNTNMVSLGIRHTLPNNWAISGHLDTGGQTSFAGTWSTATGGSNTFWNVNLHRVFPLAAATTSIFLGYQHASDRSTFGTDQTHTVSGARVGADVHWRQGPWRVKAWGAVGISPTGTSSQPGSTTGQGSGSYNEYGALIGFNTTTGWTIDGGYRWLNWGVPAGGSFSAAAFNTSGWTLGVSRTWP